MSAISSNFSLDSKLNQEVKLNTNSPAQAGLLVFN